MWDKVCQKGLKKVRSLCSSSLERTLNVLNTNKLLLIKLDSDKFGHDCLVQFGHDCLVNFDKA